MSVQRIINNFNTNMTNNQFIQNIIDLDLLDIHLCEYDDELLSDFYNELNTDYLKYIRLNINNNTLLRNRNESIGEFMRFLLQLGY